MHRLFLRPLLVVLTLIMLSVALGQSVGRLSFAVLDRLELAANQWLSAQQIRVHGLNGSWRLLNPVLSMERLEFPAGYLDGVTVEVDWLETLIRNRLVTRRLLISGGVVELLSDGQGGWRPRGMEPGGDFDLQGLVYHSDQISVDMQVVLRDGARTYGYLADYVALNRAGRHRHRLLLSSTASARACEQQCGGRFELQAQDGLWPMWEDEVQVRVRLQQLPVPTGLAGLEHFLVSRLNLQWHRQGDVSGGLFDLVADDLMLPDEVAVSVEFAGRVAGFDEAHRGVVDLLRLSHSSPDLDAAPVRWELPELRLDVQPNHAELWAGSLDVASASDFLSEALRGLERPSRWLRALNADATALNVRARVEWPELKVGFAASLADLDLDGYRGAPYMRGGAGELIGFRRGVQFSLNSQNLALRFPDTFTDAWQLAYAQGVVQLWAKDGYLGLRGPEIQWRTATHRMAGGFSIARPEDRSEERLTLLIALDEVDLDQARSYVPYTLAEGLRRWLAEGPREGTLVAPRFALHGHMHGKPGERHRRVELSSGLRGVRVRYHEDWPEISDVLGQLVVAGPLTRVELQAGRSAGATLGSGARVELLDAANFAAVDLIARAPTQDLLHFIRSTPLRDSLSFVMPGWSGAGDMRLNGELFIPLGEQEPDEDALQVDMQIELIDADLQMPDLRIAFTDLTGAFRYRYPNSLRASAVSGSTFGAPARLSARDDGGFMVLRVEGSASHDDVLHVLELDDPGVAEGRVDFTADLFMGTQDEDITRLDISTDLVGAALTLPGEFAKAAQIPRPSEVSVQFLDDHQVVSFSHASARGWLHVNEAPQRGAVGFGLAPPMLADADYLLLTGTVEGFTLDSVVPDDGDTSDAALPIKLANLRAGTIEVDDFHVEDVVLNGDITADGFAINVASPMMGADFLLDGDQPLFADVEYIVLPESDDEQADPLDVRVIPDLPDASVRVASLRVGEFDYGRWHFDMVPEPAGVRFVNLDATIHGMEVLAPQGVMWRSADDTSHFTGEVRAADLADVLPHWGYAPSVETESALLVGDLAWAGSPANIEIERLVGTAEVVARNGRFVDVETGGGAMRIFSLMNFNTIAKRMRGDFTDLTGRGLAFDELSASVRLDAGALEFAESLKVKGTGSSFEVGGRVDLVAGTLDNEMVVTLPVSKSLPWYGMYLALANPLAGAGVIVGERVLRKPMEQFSSARYQISGTIDEPEVNLVSVFGTSMSEDQEQADDEPVVDLQQDAATVDEEAGRSEI